jgi:hypothetical protein
LIYLASFVLSFPFNVKAEVLTVTATVNANSITWPVPDELSTVPKIISTLSNLIFPLVGAVLLIMIIYAGITKMTAAGDAEKEKKAMEILKNAIIGTVIIILARVIVDTISAFLGTSAL